MCSNGTVIAQSVLAIRSGLTGPCSSSEKTVPSCACLVRTGQHREIHLSFPLYFLRKSKYCFALQISSNDNLICMPLPPKKSSKKHHSFLKDIHLQDLSPEDVLFTVMLFMLSQFFKYCTASWLLGPLKLRTTERHCSRSASGQILTSWQLHCCFKSWR